MMGRILIGRYGSWEGVFIWGGGCGVGDGMEFNVSCVGEGGFFGVVGVRVCKA